MTVKLPGDDELFAIVRTMPALKFFIMCEGLFVYGVRRRIGELQIIPLAGNPMIGSIIFTTREHTS